MFEEFRRLARWCAVLTIFSVAAGCGGGGGDDGGSPSTHHTVPPSKIFVGDSGSVPPAAPTAPAIGSSSKL